MNHGPKFWLLMIALGVGFLVLWYRTPDIVSHIHGVVAGSYEECGDRTDMDCDRIFSRLGQTGDIFGAVSSLFSALALFTVAYTLWQETASRRHSRKPIVVCSVDDDKAITFDEPNTSAPRAVRVQCDLLVSSINDVAINVSVEAKLIGKDWQKSFGVSTVPVPIVNDGQKGVAVPLKLRLDTEDIQRLSSAIKEGAPVSLFLKSKFQSMVSVVWFNEAEFDLEFGDVEKARMLSLADPGDACVSLWANQAAVLCKVVPRHGSWRHYH